MRCSEQLYVHRMLTTKWTFGFFFFPEFLFILFHFTWRALYLHWIYSWLAASKSKSLDSVTIDDSILCGDEILIQVHLFLFGEHSRLNKMFSIRFGVSYMIATLKWILITFNLKFDFLLKITFSLKSFFYFFFVVLFLPSNLDFLWK